MLCALCAVLNIPYFLSSADFFTGQEAAGLPLLVQMNGEAQLPQMELVFKGKTHLAQVAKHTRPQAAILDIPMLHSLIIPPGKATNNCQCYPFLPLDAPVGEVAPELAKALGMHRVKNISF